MIITHIATKKKRNAFELHLSVDVKSFALVSFDGQLWNNLPQNLRTATSLPSFKHNLYSLIVSKRCYWIRCYRDYKLYKYPVGAVKSTWGTEYEITIIPSVRSFFYLTEGIIPIRLFHRLPLNIRPFHPRGIKLRKTRGLPRVLHDFDTPRVEWPYIQWQPMKEYFSLFIVLIRRWIIFVSI